MPIIAYGACGPVFGNETEARAYEMAMAREGVKPFSERHKQAVLDEDAELAAAFTRNSAAEAVVLKDRLMQLGSNIEDLTRHIASRYPQARIA